MSSNNKQQNHCDLQESGRSDLALPVQVTEPRSNPPQIIENAITTSTLDPDIEECEDEEFPSQVRVSKQMGSGKEHTRSGANESPGFVKKAKKLLFGSTPDSRNTDLEGHSKRTHKSGHIRQPPEQLKTRGGTNKQTLTSQTAQVVDSTQRFNQEMKKKEIEWHAKQKQLEDQLGHMQSDNERLENHIQRVQGELEHRTRILEDKVQEAKSDTANIRAEYNLFLVQKQEEDFKRMESAHWLPVEGSKMIGKLDTLKRNMRTFGKGMSTNDLSILQRLDKADYVALMNDLAEVCAVTNDGVPKELTSAKSAALLLNALLAHHVYTAFFENPFFFLGAGLGDALSKPGLGNLLNEVYKRTQRANQEEAHIWRSQTLRLLSPPLKGDPTVQEKDLHSWTDELISSVAKQQAAKFLEGPARHLMREEAKEKFASKLQNIHQTAASISYEMWTRRTTMRCCTLKHLGQRGFEPESKYFIPHSSVKYDEFEDQLEGRPISLIVHPLLEVYGTNDAKDYDRGSVWVPGEVWLDSRKPTQ